MANYDPYNEGFRDGLAVAKQMLLVEQERIGPPCIEGLSDTGNLVQVSGHNTLQRMIDRLETMLGTDATKDGSA